MAILLTTPSTAADLRDAFGNQIGEAITIFVVQHRPQFSLRDDLLGTLQFFGYAVRSLPKLGQETDFSARLGACRVVPRSNARAGTCESDLRTGPECPLFWLLADVPLAPQPPRPANCEGFTVPHNRRSADIQFPRV